MGDEVLKVCARQRRLEQDLLRAHALDALPELSGLLIHRALCQQGLAIKEDVSPVKERAERAASHGPQLVEDRQRFLDALGDGLVGGIVEVSELEEAKELLDEVLVVA